MSLSSFTQLHIASPIDVYCLHACSQFATLLLTMLQSVRTHAKAPGGKAAPAPPPPAQGGGKPAPAASKKKEIIPEVMEPETMEDENEEFGEGEYDPVDDLPAPQRRRVLALKEVQAQYDEVSGLQQLVLRGIKQKTCRATLLHACVQTSRLESVIPGKYCLIHNPMVVPSHPACVYLVCNTAPISPALLWREENITRKHFERFA